MPPSLFPVLALVFLMGQTPSTAGQAPQPLPTVLKSIGDRARRIAPDKKIRLAVIPLKGTESQRHGDKGFGGYLTEQLSTSLISAGPAIRLFERSRLDVVLKEQALSSSGLMDESEARRIGELAPIDYLLTGTFTRLERSIAIQVRFLDVVSGEVVASLSEQAELTPDLASLFEDLQLKPPLGTEVKVVGNPCETQWASVRALMEDIGSQDKVERLVKEAIALPFEGPCGKIHDHVVWHLVRYKQHSAKYRQFLANLLPAIQVPEEDDRTGAVISYLEAETSLEEGEWKALLGLMARSKRPWGYLDLLLRDREGSEVSRQRQMEHVGLILREARARRIGRPVPVEAGRLFAQILGRMRSARSGSRPPDLRAAFLCYERFGSTYGADGDKELLTFLAHLFTDSTGAPRAQALTWLGQRIAASEPDRGLADQVVRIYEQIIREEEKRPAVREVRRTPELDRLATLCGPRMAEVLPQVINRESRIELRRFCLAYGISGEEVPTLEGLLQQLKAEPVHGRQEALRMLAALGPRARAAEPEVLKLLRRAEVQSGWSGQMRYLQRDLLDFVGVLRFANPELHRILANHLTSLEPLLYEAAMHSLARIGAPVIPLLKGDYGRLEQYPKQLIARTFGLMGPAARDQIPWLRSMMVSAPNVHVRNALEDAIEALSCPVPTGGGSGTDHP